MWCRSTGFHWEYVAAIFGMTATAVICFQAADIYEVQVFRGQLRQMTRMISSWAFVFLLFIGASFFAKLGDEVSRLWLSAFFFVGLGRADCRAAVPALDGAQLGASGPARPPHHHRRLRPERRKAGRGAEGPGRFRHRHPRRVRRPQRRPRAGDLRRQSANSARSTTSSNSPAAPASTSCCSRCRFRRRRGFSRC